MPPAPGSEEQAPVSRDMPAPADDGSPVPDSPLVAGTVAERFANLASDPEKMAAFAQTLEDRGILGELVLSEFGKEAQAGDGLNVERLRAGDGDPTRNALSRAIIDRLDKIDKNKDGIVSIQELESWAGKSAYLKTDKGKFAPMFPQN